MGARTGDLCVTESVPGKPGLHHKTLCQEKEREQQHQQNMCLFLSKMQANPSGKCVVRGKFKVSKIANKRIF